MRVTLSQMRRYAVGRTLFPPTTLKRAIERIGFVQADPISAPARAQDLILRHRVKNYRAGDLERSYARLGIEEDFFVVYGFVTRSIQTLMHPRPETGVPADNPASWPAARRKQAYGLLEFARERGILHPREARQRFALGSVRNYWGGSSNATTHLLDAMHYRGMLRVARRDKGIRLYSPIEHGEPPADETSRLNRIDALVDAAVAVYAPLPGACLADLVRRLRFAAPQWRGELKSAFHRAERRLKHAGVDGVDWYWPAGEDAGHWRAPDTVRLLTPFDPLVWDRDRFELLWNWIYRFEAYTPPPKRKLGYYAMPLLWRDRVIGWGNLAVKNGRLEAEFGFVDSSPSREKAFQRELDAELDRMRRFLGLED